MSAQQTGILDITDEEYFAIPALSNSGMKDLAVSPLRYWYKHINPERDRAEEETAALLMGSALHCAVLEGAAAFEGRYYHDLKPKPGALVTIEDLRAYITSKGEKPKGTIKAQLAHQADELVFNSGDDIQIFVLAQESHATKNAGKTKLSVDEFQRIDGMATALRNEPVIDRILENGMAEVPIVWRDPETGVLLKCKLDWMAPELTLDLKSFTQKRGASINKAVSDAIYYESYHRQAYLSTYIRGLAGCGDVPFMLAFVESSEPYETRIKVLTPRNRSESNLYWEVAKEEVHGLIQLYAECLEKFGDKPWRTSQNAERLTDDDIRQLAY